MGNAVMVFAPARQLTVTAPRESHALGTGHVDAVAVLSERVRLAPRKVGA